MDRKLCYCKACNKHFIINPDYACPKCGAKLLSSAITESVWNSSSEEKKTAYKNRLASESRQADDLRHGNPSKKQKSSQAGQSKWGERIATLIAIVVAVWGIYSLFFSHDGACEDYASAGKKVLKQVVKYDSEVFVSYNSDHYNPITVNNDVSNILKEAFKNNGNPQQGDHLAANMYVAEIRPVPVKQRDGTVNLNMKLKINYDTSKEQEKELKEKADAILSRLHLDHASDYEKVRAIYNYICSNVVYDYEHLNDDTYRLQGTAYAAAVNGTAVCAGVADLFYYLATSAGLEARITWNDIHAWNFVKVNGQYYYLDATWDLGNNENEYQYFLKGSRDFIDELNTSEHVAHRPSIRGLLKVSYSPPLKDTDKDYVFSEYAYGN